MKLNPSESPQPELQQPIANSPHDHELLWSIVISLVLGIAVACFVPAVFLGAALLF